MPKVTLRKGQRPNCKCGAGMQPLGNIGNKLPVKGWVAWKCPKCGYVMSESILEAIFRICEEKGNVFNIDADYYETFLNMSDKQMESLIAVVVQDRADTINKNVLGGKWKDDDIYKCVTNCLKMIAHGLEAIRERRRCTCF
ncbi:hypothetical protein KAW55_03220 [bacterium]|nr:hypothetical protein [bacterium]